MSEGNTPPPPGDQPGGPAPGQPSGEQPAAEQPAPQQPGGAPPPAAPAPQGAAAGVGQPADLLTRFLAKLIDWILLGIVMAILFAIMGALVVSAAVGGANVFGGGGTILWSVVTSIVWTAIVLGYFAFLESSRGQTVGKMLLKLKVLGPDGGNPTMEQALKRNGYLAIYLLGVIPVLGPLLSWLGLLAANIYIAVTINNDTVSRQGWHDQFGGGTKVIKVG